MFIKNVKYKGVSLYNSQFNDEENPSYLVLQDFEMIVPYETATEDVSLYHGEVGLQTTARNRTWKISGKIADVEAFNRQYGIDYLKNIIHPEGILTKTPEYKIEWEDFQGRKFWAMARVSSEVKFSHGILSPIIDFSFELWSGDPRYYGETLHSIVISPAPIGYGLFSGDDDGVHLGTLPEEGNIGGQFYELENLGNAEAGIKVTDKSKGDGVFYINLTNGLRYGVNGVSNSRIIDTRNTPTIVTDYGIDASKDRMKGSSGLLISPGVNLISANVTLYDYDTPPLSDKTTLEWYDTYI